MWLQVQTKTAKHTLWLGYPFIFSFSGFNFFCLLGFFEFRLSFLHELNLPATQLWLIDENVFQYRTSVLLVNAIIVMTMVLKCSTTDRVHLWNSFRSVADSPWQLSKKGSTSFHFCWGITTFWRKIPTSREYDELFSFLGFRSQMWAIALHVVKSFMKACSSTLQSLARISLSHLQTRKTRSVAAKHSFSAVNSTHHTSTTRAGQSSMPLYNCVTKGKTSCQRSVSAYAWIAIILNDSISTDRLEETKRVGDHSLLWKSSRYCKTNVDLQTNSSAYNRSWTNLELSPNKPGFFRDCLWTTDKFETKIKAFFKFFLQQQITCFRHRWHFAKSGTLISCCFDFLHRLTLIERSRGRQMLLHSAPCEQDALKCLSNMFVVCGY